jgi:hypothetical protein
MCIHMCLIMLCCYVVNVYHYACYYKLCKELYVVRTTQVYHMQGILFHCGNTSQTGCMGLL